jgi:5-formyltetrahydrofolate cyclo-ligase
MLSELGSGGPASVLVDVVHDCQVVDDDLAGEDHDVPVDWIVTPTRCLHVPDNGRAPGRVRWEMLTDSPLQSVPPLKELASLRR